MTVTAAQLKKISKGGAETANILSIVNALDRYGRAAGLDLPHRLAHFLAQVAHESGGFHYDREVWGPTPAQARYDTRVDLGNTPAKDGDGFKNRGRGPIQLTGGANIRAFHAWCVAEGYDPPDFVADPDLINTDPWEGLSAIYFWDRGNPTGKSLNVLADANDIEQITKKINGGLNGFADRLDYYTRAALVLLNYGPTEVRAFQTVAQAAGYLPKGGGQIDGDAGPKTRAALHMMLVHRTPGAVDAPDVQKSPVTVTETVVPKGVEKRKGLWSWGSAGLLAGLGNAFAPLMGLPWQAQVALGVVAVAAVAFFLIKGESIVRRVKAIVAEAEK